MTYLKSLIKMKNNFMEEREVQVFIALLLFLPSLWIDSVNLPFLYT